MIGMSLDAAAADLQSNPRPVIFLDTCDLVNILQVITKVPLRELRAVERLLLALAADPLRCQPVGTYVTAAEYSQNTDLTNPVYLQERNRGSKMPVDEITIHLRELDQQIARLHALRQFMGVPLPAPTIYSHLGLLNDLRVVVDMLLAHCWELQQDQTCVNAAVQRVFGKTRPSQKREVKDSIHLEHCLDLTRRLRNNAFGLPVLFVSANTGDYGPRGAGHQPHLDLQAEFAGIQLLYFDSLGDGIAHLGI